MQQINYPRDPLNHFDVLEDDACSCAICTGWRRAKIAFDRASKGKPQHATTCHCETCDPIHDVRYTLQAFNNRRDLWIESSYHASKHKYGESYMEWLAREAATARNRIAWWAQSAELPMSYWFQRFEWAVRAGSTTVTGAVSGYFNFAKNYKDEEEEGGGHRSISYSVLDEHGIGVGHYEVGGDISDIMLVTI